MSVPSVHRVEGNGKGQGKRLGQDVGSVAYRSQKWYNDFGKWHFLIKLNISLLYGSATPLLGVPQEK